MTQKTPPNILDQIYQEVIFLKIIINDLKQERDKPPIIAENQFKYLPIKEIFLKKLMTRSTFYKYMKEGKYKLYKFGGRSYVDRTEFENAFRGVKLHKLST